MTITFKESLTPTHEQGEDPLHPKPPAEDLGPRAQREVPQFVPYGSGIDGEAVGTEKTLRDVRKEVGEELGQLGFDEEVREAAEAVVQELADNAVRAQKREQEHGLKSVEVGVSTEHPDTAVLVVEDKIPGFTTEEDRVGNIEHGRGTTIVKELAAESGYEPVLDPDGNEVGKKVWVEINKDHLQELQESGAELDGVSEEDLLEKFDL